MRITKTELKKKPKHGGRRYKTYRPRIRHHYDTDTELVLKLSLKNAKRARPKLDKTYFEHPKLTVIYSKPNQDDTLSDHGPYTNNTITSVKVQSKGPGFVLPILIVASILLLGAFSVIFALLMRQTS